MAEPIRTVAILVANPALSSLLSMTLAGAWTLRVRPFETQLGLTTYMRLAPAELVVADFDSETVPAHRLARDLRADTALACRDFQIIALASALTPASRAAAMRAGIDEIIAKPMSPKYLVERVLARLARVRQGPVPEQRVALRRRDWSAFGDNIVSLSRYRRPEHAL